MNNELYLRFLSLTTDFSWIGLAKEQRESFFCTPIDAQIIGWDNGIHYCFIKDFGNYVFCVNPETCCEHYVYPVAKNFYDFLGLILETQNTNTIQQVITWNKRVYLKFINDSSNLNYSQKQEVCTALNAIRGLDVSPLENAFDYIKDIQSSFHYEKIRFSDEYYRVTGLIRRK